MAEGLLQLGHSGTAPLGSLRAADPPMRGSLSFEEWRLQDKHSRGPGVCGLPPTLPSFLSVFPSLPFLFYSLLSMFCVCVLGTFNEALTKTPIDLFYTPHVTDTKRWGGGIPKELQPWRWQLFLGGEEERTFHRQVPWGRHHTRKSIHYGLARGHQGTQWSDHSPLTGGEFEALRS